VIEELDLAAAEGAGDGWGNRVREGGGRFDESFATWEAMGGHVSRFVVEWRISLWLIGKTGA